ncbi:hypothetical protein C7441_107224, partial [Pseudaminobacter salicylatoxidans]
ASDTPPARPPPPSTLIRFMTRVPARAMPRIMRQPHRRGINGLAIIFERCFASICCGKNGAGIHPLFFPSGLASGRQHEPGQPSLSKGLSSDAQIEELNRLMRQARLPRGRPCCGAAAAPLINFAVSPAHSTQRHEHRVPQIGTTLPSESVTRRSIRPASSWLWVAISAASPDWRTSAESASNT